MGYIGAVGTALPPHQYRQGDVTEFIRRIFADFPNLERYLPVFEHTRIEQRSFCMPMEWYLEDQSFSVKNRQYLEQAVALSEKAISACLESANVPCSEIGHLFFISSTGIATPSIDARLMNRLPFSPHMKRTPVWGLGCAGGACGIARAFEYVRAFPEEKALVVALELCSLTFLRNDYSKRNLIATSLFADGAAAALICGENTASGPGVIPRILDARSTLFPDSLDVMGWEIQEEGLKVIFSRSIPSIVRSHVSDNFRQFLDRHQLSNQQVKHFLFHPGGAKVLSAFEEILGITPFEMRHSWEVLRRHGNMSSATVLFVLERFFQERHVPGEHGILSALGPGFSSELVLFETVEP